MSLARSFPAATRGANGRIYVIDGLNSAFPALANFESYTPILNSWSALSATPTARYGLAAVLAQDGRIYAFGGADALGNPLAANQSFSTVGAGAAAPPLGKDLPPALSSDPTLTVLSTDSAHAVLFLREMDEGIVPGGGAGDSSGWRNELAHALVAKDDSLSADLADVLFAGPIR